VGLIHAIAPLGRTGELAHLDENEFDAVADTTIAAVGVRTRDTPAPMR
jgi:dihydrodipicolinate synthase/N-acetylneuraminate lyase